jgi:hypothetical protein
VVSVVIHLKANGVTILISLESEFGVVPTDAVLKASATNVTNVTTLLIGLDFSD